MTGLTGGVSTKVEFEEPNVCLTRCIRIANLTMYSVNSVTVINVGWVGPRHPE